ncbi:MAG: FAD-binding protein [Thermoanaerobacterales bacterium]|nr:FAD-binding protein [Thermoanaerobacterales bacterium]
MKRKSCGVIAKQKDENYIRLNGGAVILATGGYEGNQKMRYKYLPGLGKFLDNTEIMGRPTNTGDGHLMALWVGADMDGSVGRS